MSAPLASPSLARVPGLVHGFGRRAPGEETRDETRARVAASLEPLGTLLLLKQVHGTRIVEAPWTGTPEADGALARDPGLLLGIETADCLPILLVDPQRRSVAAVHAGWRGTAAKIAERAVEALLAQGSRPVDLLAALGPAIGWCCYEVGDELREPFGADAAAVLRPAPDGRLHLDLRQANVLQLTRAGVPAAQISLQDECTACLRERYHSYRRDGRGCGRMISFAGFAAERPGPGSRGR